MPAQKGVAIEIERFQKIKKFLTANERSDILTELLREMWQEQSTLTNKQ